MTITRIENKATRDIFAVRRHALMASLTENDAVIFPAAKEYLRTPEIEYPYRQDCNVLYLTNYPEPDSVVVLLPKRQEGEFVLFNLPKDSAQEVWTGKRVGQQGAIQSYHADQAFSVEKLEDTLPELLKSRKRVYFPYYHTGREQEDKQVLLFCEAYFLELSLELGFELVDVLPMVNEMRLIKSLAELELMQEAIRITGAGHRNAMRHCRPGLYEYQLDAKLMEAFYDRGSRFPAYPNIVASGASACTLHYEENSKQIRDGELILIDAGAEYKGYAADITRTFPANGRFTKEQKQIYNLVLKAQAAGIEATKPGATWKAIRALVARVITEGLVELGLLQGEVDALVESGAYKKFYMHGPGHWIGLDTHDVGSKDKDGVMEGRPFEPGMVLTMEPGIYISDQHQDVPSQWHNIAVRIEDMLLVTGSGCRVLSAGIPKSIVEIEFSMANARSDRARVTQQTVSLADKMDGCAFLRRSV